MTQPFIASLDTMKLSKDQAGASMTAQQIAHDVGVLASLKPTHISVNTPMDQLSRAAMWIDAIHAAGCGVYLRMHTSKWEAAGGQLPADYLSELRTALTTLAPKLRAGDVVDPCTESENGWTVRIGKGWTGDPAQVAVWNTFAVDGANVVRSVCPEVTVRHSVNSYFATTPKVYYPSTLTAFDGVLTCDVYPDSNAQTPATALAAFQAQIDAIRAGRPGVPIMLGEWGWSIHMGSSDAQQQSVVQAVTQWVAQQPDIVGLNYWPALGDPAHADQTATLCHGTPGNMALRPSAQPVVALFAAKAAPDPRIGRAQFIVQNAFQILRGEATPLPPPDDYWVTELTSGATLGAVVNAIFASSEGQAALNKPLS